ncbi:MAG: Adenine-specific methylase [Myxococcaceae bacterium]|nr:Adenine-specific methylase [Myxococcaceae bacterium]
MIKYIGSKRLLVPAIVDIVGRVSSQSPVRRVLDLFSGTSRVGHALKAAGYEVTANDHTTYAYKLAQCYVAADRSQLLGPASQLLTELNQLAGQPGYFTETFCERSRYLQPQNGARVDAIRARIAALSLDPTLEAVLLVSLMEAADRVDSTCGLQMAYLKKWSARSHNALELRMPALLDGPGHALQQEARQAASAASYDLVYLDPPYNQHRYLGNYHVWESLVRWDKPEVYGTAMKRIDCKEYKSDFNSRPRIASALAEVAYAVDARHLLLSFSNEGYLTRADVQEMLRARGEVAWIDVDYKRYVGAQIGIYNPSGEKVGKVSHLRNRECLFLVGPNATRLLRDPNWGEQLSLKLAK